MKILAIERRWGIDTERARERENTNCSATSPKFRAGLVDRFSLSAVVCVFARVGRDKTHIHVHTNYYNDISSSN